MRKNLIFLIASVLVLSVTSCKKATYLTADKDQIISLKEGEVQTICLHSDVADYNLTYSPEWAQATLADSVLTIIIGYNATSEHRTDSIVVECSEQRLVIPVVQYDEVKKLKASTHKVHFGMEGGLETVSIDTDVPGLECTYPDGITAIFADNVLTILAQPNTGKSLRGTISLKAGDKTQNIAVTVEGNDCKQCNGTGMIKCRKCRGYGEICRENGNDEEIYYGCSECGGSGKRYVDYFRDCGKLYVDESGKTTKGSGKKVCPTCNGTGEGNNY